MKTKFIRFQPQPLISNRSLYLNLINDRRLVINDINALYQTLEDVIKKNSTVPASQQPIAISRATDQAIQERFAEIKGAAISFKTTQVAEHYTDKEMLSALEGLVKQIEPAGVKLVKPGMIIINDICTLYYDQQGKVSRTEPEIGLNGYLALEIVAGICAQDFGLIIERDHTLIYLYGSARYEKTPKNITNGFDYFLGEDFLEWHRRIPGIGPTLANLFASMYQAFKKDQFDQLIVDLTGRNLYTNSEFKIKRYERDYALPLLVSEQVVGMTVFADSLFKNVDDGNGSFLDGHFLEINSPVEFHNSFRLIIPDNFQPHPEGMRK